MGRSAEDNNKVAFFALKLLLLLFNPLTPNEHSSGRTAPLTSKRYILYIYSRIQVLNILNVV